MKYKFTTRADIKIPISWEVEAKDLDEAIQKMKALDKKEYTWEGDSEKHVTDGYGSFGWIPKGYKILNSEFGKLKKFLSQKIMKKVLGEYIDGCDLSLEDFNISSDNEFYEIKQHLINTKLHAPDLFRCLDKGILDDIE